GRRGEALPGRRPGHARRTAAARAGGPRIDRGPEQRARADARAGRARSLPGGQPAPAGGRPHRAGHERQGAGSPGGGGAGGHPRPPGVPGAAFGAGVSLHYSASRFLLGGLVGALSGWEVRGRENVPKMGAVIVASNHISFWDPLLVGTAAVREQHFLAKEELFRPPVFGWLIRSFNAIPIRRGVADLRGLTQAME